MGVKRLIAVAFDGETDPALASLVDDVVWIKVGQFPTHHRVSPTAACSCASWLGRLHQRTSTMCDPICAAGSAASAQEKNSHTIFGGIADELKKDGVDLIEANPWLEPLLPGLVSCSGQSHPSRSRLTSNLVPDCEGSLPLGERPDGGGQGGHVGLAVVGFEGTDKCLARGGELAGKQGGAIAVKVAKVGTTCDSTSRASAPRPSKSAPTPGSPVSPSKRDAAW